MEKWLDPKTIAIWIIIVIIVITVLVVSFIKMAKINFKRIMETHLRESEMKLEYQQKLLETGIEAQEQERIRIASDLHDSLIGKLTIMRLKNQTDYKFEEIDNLMAESIADARRISHDLFPPMLELVSADELIENTLSSWKKVLNISFYRSINTGKELTLEIKTQIVRVLQETIINIHKHAEAKNVFVNLRLTNNWFSLTISDNGKGFDPEKGKKGIGLKNIELRMLYLKGLHKIKTGKQGTTLIILLNLTKFDNDQD